ncbi:hypothetical protein JI739_07530 [Ramlibacter sp. AW1]|uniref:Uncharacterized protein n=1 Tax=Ramlibacter aurantiacus TaxID=2801330 RepID=A0A936ZM33_9BURK|nr:hypothetical protein [Ramlibacter aurantiacus]MBL0420196.1 hypothetical protein [Ramlibacter aurantiacus]
MDPASSSFVPGRHHARRLREIHRSAGWPCLDGLELELLAAGLVERLRDEVGRECLRLTASGIELVARQMAHNRAALSAHEALVRRVAREMLRAGRIAWCGLSLRARSGPELPWGIARPDVFSIRQTSVEAYLEPLVHEVKVRRSDLLADLRQPGKRAAYLDLAPCWYVLGQDARGRSIGEPDEIPAECGVLMASGGRLVLARAPAAGPRDKLPFAVWMALAKATPVADEADDAQGLLGEPQSPSPSAPPEPPSAPSLD